MPATFSNPELHELVSLYALGALNADEAEAFERHLRDGCPACEAELRVLREVTDEVVKSAAADPPAGLRGRLTDNVKKAPKGPGVILDQGGLLISHSSEISWQPLAPGIEFKPLYTDDSRHYATSLVRMEAGSRYSSHHHRESEELFMLSGDLHVEGEVMRAGDYCRAALDTVHGETFSESGCLFLLMASQDNEILS